MLGPWGASSADILLLLLLMLLWTLLAHLLPQMGLTSSLALLWLWLLLSGCGCCLCSSEHLQLLVHCIALELLICGAADTDEVHLEAA